MNSNRNNLASIFNFVTLLLSQSRSLFAMIALAAWLIISISFYGSQPDQNEAVNLNDLSSPIAKFWHEYGWQYEDHALKSVYFANDQQGWAVGEGITLTTQDGGKNWIMTARFIETRLPEWYSFFQFFVPSFFCSDYWVFAYLLGPMPFQPCSPRIVRAVAMNPTRWNPKNSLGRCRAFCVISVPSRR